MSLSLLAGRTVFENIKENEAVAPMVPLVFFSMSFTEGCTNLLEKQLHPMGRIAPRGGDSLHPPPPSGSALDISFFSFQVQTILSIFQELLVEYLGTQQVQPLEDVLSGGCVANVANILRETMHWRCTAGYTRDRDHSSVSCVGVPLHRRELFDHI